MNLFTAAIFGILQGATEFLPISSSAHLALAHYFFGAEEAGLTFDVALHLGTLLAIVIYFRDDFWQMGKAVLGLNPEREEAKKLRTMSLYICLATIPGVLAGLLLGDIAEQYFRHPALVAAVLAGAGLLLLLADQAGRRVRDFGKITLTDFLGRKVDQRILPSQNIFPDTIRDFETEIGHKLMIGPYKASFLGSYG